MSGKGMPMRGGNRGGKDQFDWEDVKVDKDRENYLGHSVKASVGRWQKGKDLTWYTKKSKVSGHNDQLKLELAALKRAEEEAMAAALGLKPPALVHPQQALTQQEMSEVCRRRSQDEVEDGEERIKGIGYQSRRAQVMFIGNKSTTNKEGATIFEHDSEVHDDGRLKMPEHRRISQSDNMLSPTSLNNPPEEDTTPPTTGEPKPVVAMTITPQPPPLCYDDNTKKSKKSKKPKRHKKAKTHSKHKTSSSSESDSWVKKTVRDRKKKGDFEDRSKLKKRKRDESSKEEWTEKKVCKATDRDSKRTHDDSRSPDSRSRRRARHDSLSGESEEDRKTSMKRRHQGGGGRRSERPRYQRQDGRRHNKDRDYHNRR